MTNQTNDEKQMVSTEIEIDKRESISSLSITCSQRCSNWFRIFTFMMINGRGSPMHKVSIGK